MAGKKKTKRIVTDGIAHIQASFNNTIVMITDMGGKRYVGQHLVALDSRVHVKVHLLLHRLQLKEQAIWQKTWAW